jgi:hypothetical protein
MEKKDFYDLIKIEADEINHFFARASKEGRGTSQEISDRRENALKAFLQRYFPYPFRVAKGNIIDSYGLRSNSIDCIILNPIHPFTVTTNDMFSIILVDGVDIAIELKPNLSSKKEIFRSLDQIRSVKKLRRVNSCYMDLEHVLRKRSEIEIENGKQIPSVIFSTKTYTDIMYLIKNIGSYYIEKQIPRREQFDLIIINKRGILFNSKKDHYVSLKNYTGLFFIEFEEETLIQSLFWLNKFPKAEMQMSSPIVGHYIDTINAQRKMYWDRNINQELLKMD